MPRNLVTKTEATLFVVSLSVAALFLSYLAGKIVLVLCLFGLLIGFCYSIPPLRLKNRPPADLISNAVGFGLIAFLMGYQSEGSLTHQSLLRAIPYVVAMAGIYVNTCIPDIEGDLKVGDTTICAMIGKEKSAWVALLFIVVASLLSIVLGEMLCLIGTVIALPAAVGLAIDPWRECSVLTSQIVGRGFFITVSILMPLLALIGLLTYVGSKVYYARRLRIDYPRIDGAKPLRPKAQSTPGEDIGPDRGDIGRYMDSLLCQ